jgi:hypothetical protein
MQPVAEWLVAKPERAVMVMVGSFLLPLTRIFGSAVLVLLTLRHGAKRAGLMAAISLAVILVVSLIGGQSIPQIVLVMFELWLPGMFFAVLLQRMRSLTLLLQATVLIAIAVVAGMYLVLGDPAAYWRELLVEFAEIWRQSGLEQEAELFMGLQPYAGQMTSIFVAIGWLMQVGMVLLGYAAYRRLPGETANYGRFRDLNFGRVLALILAVTSILGAAIGSLWLQSTAFVLFVVFWLQGLAILHWLRGIGKIPVVVLFLAYGTLLIPGLNLLSLSGIAIVGYSDAWFQYRARIASDNKQV